MRAGIQIIYQDFSLFPNLTVAENISFNHELSKRRKLVRWPEVRRTAQRALDKVGVAIPLDILVERLSVADKQVVAIARALVQGARLIAMDEPTTALTEHEVQALFGVVRQLKSDGVAAIFVSHKLPEVFAICERIIVLRNGSKVADGPAGAFDIASLSQHMIGRRLEQHASARSHELGAELLRVEALGRSGQFDDVSFSLRAGEVSGHHRAARLRPDRVGECALRPCSGRPRAYRRRRAAHANCIAARCDAAGHWLCPG